MTDTTKAPIVAAETSVTAPVERDYFIPAFNVTVKATSIDEALSKAKKVKGTK